MTRCWWEPVERCSSCLDLGGAGSPADGELWGRGWGRHTVCSESCPIWGWEGGIWRRSRFCVIRANGIVWLPERKFAADRPAMQACCWKPWWALLGYNTSAKTASLRLVWPGLASSCESTAPSLLFLSSRKQLLCMALLFHRKVVKSHKESSRLWRSKLRLNIYDKFYLPTYL